MKSNINQLIECMTLFMEQLKNAETGNDVHVVLENIEILLSQNDEVSRYRADLLGTVESVRKHQVAVSCLIQSLNTLIEHLKELSVQETNIDEAQKLRNFFTALADHAEEILRLLNLE